MFDSNSILLRVVLRAYNELLVIFFNKLLTWSDLKKDRPILFDS